MAEWDRIGILKQVLHHKLIFIETRDIVETSLALESFKRACDSGRGGVFLSIARGKVSEGIDFDHHYGRAVVLFGIPFQYTLSRVLRCRLQYLYETLNIRYADDVFDRRRILISYLVKVTSYRLTPCGRHLSALVESFDRNPTMG